MKKIITLIFALSISLFISGQTGYAKNGRNQGKGGGGEVRNREQNPDRGRVRDEDRRGTNRGPERDRDRDDDRDDNRVRDNREARESRFEDRLERNPELRSKLERLLPAGSNVRTAASGFKNQGQFIAALHVSQNLGIPFAQLKTRMTGSNPMSLGQAIHDLKPNLPEKDARREANRAEKQAKETEKSKRTT